MPGSTPGRRWPATAATRRSSRPSTREIQRDGSPEQAAAYEQAAPVEQLFAGYDRYWNKKT